MADPAINLVQTEQRFRRQLLGGVFLVLALGGLAQRHQRALFVPPDRLAPSETAFAYSAIIPGGGRIGGFGFDVPRWIAPSRPRPFVRRTPGGGAPGGVTDTVPSPSAFVAVPDGGGAGNEPGLESPGATSPGFAQTTSDGGFVVNGPAALGGGGSGTAPGGGGSPGGGNVIVVPGAVPEPASWLLMILGFGFVGTMLRRRRDPSRIGTRVTA